MALEESARAERAVPTTAPSGGLAVVARLWRHMEWADAALLAALEPGARPSVEALREYAHVIAAEEVWLARIERRAPTVSLWPALGYADLSAVAARVRDGYARLLASVDEGALAAPVAYVNSAGRAFETPLGEILVHVALHGQYHRGKVNLLLRQCGAAPAPVDYIAYARGEPAARQGGGPVARGA